MYSNRYTSNNVPSKLNPKSITSHFDKEQLGYWFDPNVDKFLSNFSVIKVSKKADSKEVATNIWHFPLQAFGALHQWLP